MNWLTHIPFLRLLFPFIAGISIGLTFEPEGMIWLLSVLFMLLCYLQYNQNWSLSKWVFLIGADAFLIFYGVQLVELKNTSHGANYYGKFITTDSATTFISVVDDVPVQKKQFVKLQLRLIEINRNHTRIPVEGKLLAYIRRSSHSGELLPGQTLLLRAKLTPPESPKNPNEFDYAAYLYHQQIYHTAFVDSDAYNILPVKAAVNVLWEFGLKCKHFILRQLKTGGLHEEAVAICSALLTGYDDEIDRSIMQDFSHSGTLHVLSVSGLHTGLIYVLLAFFFDFFDPHKRHKLFKFIFITLSLWGFALLTGLSAPVLRAVIMFNLFGFGKLYFRQDQRNQLNLLCVSAFILLMYNPYFITDIGFLLSYTALFGLIVFEPVIAAVWQPVSPITNLIWKSVSTSFAATLSTLPLTLFYFKQFPYWFFIANLVVIPATFLLLILALFAVFQWAIIIQITNALVTFLLTFIRLFDSENYAYLDRINFDALDAFWICLLILVVSLALHTRFYRLWRMSLLVLCFWLFCNILQTYELLNKTIFTVYDIRKKEARSLKNTSNIYYYISDSTQFDYRIKPHFIALGNPIAKHQKFNYFKSNEMEALILNQKGYWPHMDFSKIKLLMIANDVELSEEDLKEFSALETIVVDNSNRGRSVQQIEELCRKFGLVCYATPIKGAFQLELNEIKNRR